MLTNSLQIDTVELWTILLNEAYTVYQDWQRQTTAVLAYAPLEVDVTLLPGGQKRRPNRAISNPDLSIRGQAWTGRRPRRRLSDYIETDPEKKRPSLEISSAPLAMESEIMRGSRESRTVGGRGPAMRQAGEFIAKRTLARTELKSTKGFA